MTAEYRAPIPAATSGSPARSISANTEAFDRWIRSSFVEMNTELENLYFAQPDRASVLGIGDRIKHLLRDEGHVHVVTLRAEGNHAMHPPCMEIPDWPGAF